MTGKKELRENMKQERIFPDHRIKIMTDAVICGKIICLAEKHPGLSVFVYMAKKEEVNTDAAILELLERNFPVAAPRVYGKELKFHRIFSLDDLEKGSFGLREPKEFLPVMEPDHSLFLVPGLAFGKQGERLGYGAGYYDRYFKKNPGNIKIGICYDFQADRIFETDSNDIPMTGILTEKREPVLTNKS